MTSRWPCARTPRPAPYVFPVDEWLVACDAADLSPDAWGVVSALVSVIDRLGSATPAEVLDAAQDDQTGDMPALISGCRELGRKRLLLDLGEKLAAVLPTITIHQEA